MGKSCINEPKVATIKRPDERIVKETWIKKSSSCKMKPRNLVMTLPTFLLSKLHSKFEGTLHLFITFCFLKRWKAALNSWFVFKTSAQALWKCTSWYVGWMVSQAHGAPQATALDARWPRRYLLLYHYSNGILKVFANLLCHCATSCAIVHESVAGTRALVYVFISLIKSRA